MDLPASALLLNAALIFLGVGAIAYIAATYCLRAMLVHDLAIEATRLRDQYHKRLESLRHGITEVELVTPGFEHTDSLDADPSAPADTPQAEAA